MKATAALVPLEWEEQAAFFDWFDRAAFGLAVPSRNLMLSIPNGAILGGDARLRAMQAARLKATGMRTGACDVLLLVARGGFHGMLIEFKRRKGSRVEPEQDAFIADARRAGYNAVVAWGADEAIRAVSAYLKQPATLAG